MQNEFANLVALVLGGIRSSIGRASVLKAGDQSFESLSRKLSPPEYLTLCINATYGPSSVLIALSSVENKNIKISVTTKCSSIKLNSSFTS
jgi:hypothetical protein